MSWAAGRCCGQSRTVRICVDIVRCLDTIAVAALVTLVLIGGHRLAREKDGRIRLFFICVAVGDTGGSSIVVGTTIILVSTVIDIIVIALCTSITIAIAVAVAFTVAFTVNVTVVAITVVAIAIAVENGTAWEEGGISLSLVGANSSWSGLVGGSSLLFS
jgi:hypothetical protein